MASCCGEERTSKFCPECGSKIADAPLQQIVKYCKHWAEHHEARKQRYHETIAYKNDDDRKKKSRLERYEKLASRWREWADAIEAVLNNK